MVLDIPDAEFPGVWMRVVNASTGEQLFNLDDRLFYWTFGGDIVAFSPDGSKVLLTTVGHDYVVDMEDGQMIGDLGETGATWSATFTEDGNRLLTSTTGSLMLWDLGGGVENLGSSIRLEHDEAIWINPNWALDRSRLAVQLFTSDGLPGYGYSIAVLDERTGAVTQELAALGTGLADGRFLVTPFMSLEHERRVGPLAIWDPETGKLIELTGCSALQGDLFGGSPVNCPEGEQFFGNHANFPSVVSSPDGSFFAAESYTLAGNPRLVRIWNAQSLQVQFEYETLESEHLLDAGPTWLVAFDNNSSEAIIRDVTSGEVIQRLDNAAYFPTIQAISPDGSVLYLTRRDEGWVEAYDTSTWELLATWESHDAPNRGLAVSPDGDRLVTTSRGNIGMVKVWDVSEIQDRSSAAAPPPLLDRIPAPFPSDAAWLADDRLVVFLAGARWYEVSLAVDDLVADVQSQLTRTFTVAECATYQIDPCPTLEEVKGGS
jgi:WD40 repeat protein